MKRCLLAVLILAMGMLIANSASAQMDAIAKLDIGAIRKMQFVDNGKELVAKDTVVFSNGGTTEIKLRNAAFKVSLKTAAGVVPMGDTVLAELLLPAGTAEQAAELTTEMEIKIGPKNDETIQRLISLFNVIGDPSSTFTLMLDGTAELGIKAEKGWIYQKGIAVELEFQPSIQREVLFK